MIRFLRAVHSFGDVLDKTNRPLWNDQKFRETNKMGIDYNMPQIFNLHLLRPQCFPKSRYNALLNGLVPLMR